jgi:hypothetical protein
MKNLAEKFVESLGFAYPMAFESGDPDFPYCCGGTCFAIRFRGNLFIFTATHCLEGRKGTPVILGPGKRWIPIRQSFPLNSDCIDNDWADITCFSTFGSEHWPAFQDSDVVDGDALVLKEVSIGTGDLIVFKGYPASNTTVEVDPARILRKPSLHLGCYGGATDDKHCHYAYVFHPSINDPNGLSGTPVVKIECEPGGEPFPTLLGMITRGGAGVQFMRFVGLNIILRVLKAVCEHDGNSN